MSTSKLHLALIFCLVLAAGVLPAEAMEQPEVVYETAVDGYNLPHAHDIVVDAGGNAFFIGSAYEDGATLDVLVARIDADGTHAWTRYIARYGHSYATGLVLDSQGAVWVTGFTDVEDFPTVDAMDSTLTGFRDIFLMQLDPTDGSLLYSTYIGGDYTDAALDIAINDDDEIYLTGYTGSTDFPVSADAYQSEPGFPEYFYQDAFIMKLAPGGRSISYSTYFGGIHDDTAHGIDLDPDGNIIIAGTTDGFEFPLVDPIQAEEEDMFVTKLSADGQQVLFSTYLGGEDVDRPVQVKVDEAGDVFLAGITRSIDFPTTPGAYQEAFVGAINGCSIPFGGDFNCEDMFLTKLSTTGAGLLWSTYLGGTDPDESRDIALGPDGAVYLAGYTSSEDFPPDGVDFGAAYLVARFDATGEVLDYAYTIDSGSANRGNGIAVGPQGDLYLTGTRGVPASLTVTRLGNRFATPVGNGLPDVARLRGNYPNPFNPSTTIAFTLPREQDVSLKVYDVRGREVADLVSGTLEAGDHQVRWNVRGVADGVYMSRLTAGQVSQTRKMTLVK